MEAAVLVPYHPPAPHDDNTTITAFAAMETDPEGLALVQALIEAEAWPSQIIAAALADLGDIRLPEPKVPSRNVEVLSALPVLYWVFELDQSGLLRAAETVVGLWASGAIQITLPDRGETLHQYWRTRRERLSAEERAHLLNLVFNPQDFEPAMQRMCRAITALADNAGQHDIREEVGLEHTAFALLDLCATRLEGAPLLAAPDLLKQTMTAVQILSQRPLQSAFAVRNLYEFIELAERSQSAPIRQARHYIERAQSGAAVLRWLAQSAAGRFVIDPRHSALQTLIAHAQRWLMSPGNNPAIPPQRLS